MNVLLPVHLAKSLMDKAVVSTIVQALLVPTGMILNKDVYVLHNMLIMEMVNVFIIMYIMDVLTPWVLC
jgi:hypothetical protein